MNIRRAFAQRAWLGVVAGAGLFQFAAPAVAATCDVVAKVSPSSIGIPDYVQDATGKWIPNSLTINGNGSKPRSPDGKYQWSFPGTVLGTLGNATTSQATFNPPNVTGASQQVRIRLTVSATGCPSSSDDILVTVTDAREVLNNAPHAVPSATPQSAGEGAVVTLDGSLSYDPEHDPLTYAWVQTAGPAVALQPTANPAAVTFVAPNLAANALLTFRLTVTDPGRLSSVDTVDVNVNWNNDAPVARLQCPAGLIEVDERAPVTLDASGSTDSDNGIVSYAWEQLVGLPEVAGVTGWNQPTIVFDAPSLGQGQTGLVPFKVTVTDASGAKSSAQCSVFIRDVTRPAITVPSPSPAIAEATSPAGANVSYVATAFDAVDGSLPIGSGNFLCEAPSGSQFAIDATTPVLCSAKDSAGNVSEAGFSIRVVDTVAPVIPVPQSLALEATGPGGAAALFDVRSNDAVDGERPATCAPASGSTFAINAPGPVTSVHCDATDTHGNAAAPVMFEVAVHDTRAPVFDASTVSAGLVLEATSPTGAVATFATPVANDLVDLANVAVSCAPASGSTFAITDTTVRCDATDSRHNTTGGATSATFNVRVQDSTPPSFKGVPANATIEATSAAGAVFNYIAPTASDLVDGNRTVTCTPPSGTFALGMTTVTCTAGDTRGNTASTGFDVDVTDTTAPLLTVPGGLAAEASGPTGASVAFVALANDIVDGSVVPVCTATSGATFPIGTTQVTRSATDAHGNVATAGFAVVVRDSTPPLLTLPLLQPVEATGPGGAAVAFDVSATDTVDGSIAPLCSAASGSVFPLGTTTVNCSATDAHGNRASGSFNVQVVDTTAPAIAPHGDVSVKATGNSAAIVQYVSPTATDLVDGAVAVACSPASGSSFAIGSTPVNCTATDSRNNTSKSSFAVIVSYDFAGFFQPVDAYPAMNAVKAGSAVPVKFNLGGNQGLSIFASNSPSSGVVACNATAEDAIEETATASTSSLQYDGIANQYIYVWKTDKSWVGQCRVLTVKLKDGSSKAALFKFK